MKQATRLMKWLRSTWTESNFDVIPWVEVLIESFAVVENSDYAGTITTQLNVPKDRDYGIYRI